MSCDVCISSSYDGDGPAWQNDSTPRAKVRHVCCECGDAILPGEMYHKTVGKWEGGVDTYKTCLACDEIRCNLCCDGWTYGALWEDAAASSLFEPPPLTVRSSRAPCCSPTNTPAGGTICPWT